MLNFMAIVYVKRRKKTLLFDYIGSLSWCFRVLGLQTEIHEKSKPFYKCLNGSDSNRKHSILKEEFLLFPFLKRKGLYRFIFMVVSSLLVL